MTLTICLSTAQICFSSMVPGHSQGWSHNYDGFVIHGTNVAVEIRSHAQTNAEKLRAYYESHPTSKNLAIVTVWYVTTGGDIKKEELPQVFLSGWDVPEDIKTIISAIGSPMSLGSCYDALSTEDVRNLSLVTGGKTLARNNLIGDFNRQDVHIDPSKEFPFSSYAHSEQAFISCVLQDKIGVNKRVKPQAVIIQVNSYHPACTSCRPALVELIKNSPFKDVIIKKLFKDDSNSDIPMHVVYVSSDLDVLTMVDFSKFPSYFVDTRR